MTKRQGLLALGLMAGGATVGAQWTTVFAGGIPPTNPLYYAGTLTEGGQPVSDSRQLTVNLWKTPGSVAGESPLCIATTVTVMLVGGHFRVALDPSCKDAINANQSVYVEVIDGTTSLGRLKIGAVPYAVEADHAPSADNAAYAADAGHAATADTAQTASGALLASLAQLQGDVQTLQQQVSALQDAGASVQLASEVGIAGDLWYADCQSSVSSPTPTDSLPIQACARMANSKCVALGYRAGWTEGDSDGSEVTITCLR